MFCKNSPLKIELDTIITAITDLFSYIFNILNYPLSSDTKNARDSNYICVFYSDLSSIKLVIANTSSAKNRHYLK